MTNWKKFTITDIKISPRSVEILDFYLNEPIEHNNGNWENYIPLMAQVPFSGWGVDSCIEIDVERVKKRFSYGRIFGSETVRGVNAVLNLYDSSVTLRKQKEYLKEKTYDLEKERDSLATERDDWKRKKRRSGEKIK